MSEYNITEMVKAISANNSAIYGNEYTNIGVCEIQLTDLISACGQIDNSFVRTTIVLLVLNFGYIIAYYTNPKLIEGLGPQVIGTNIGLCIIMMYFIIAGS